MAETRIQRRLAAILAADMVGFTRLVEIDEAGTILRQKTHREEFIDREIAAHGGRIVKSMGDGLLVEFASVVDAVQCAVVLQTGMTEREAGVSAERRIRYRIGINLGDIIIDGDDIYGTGVNVAARMEGLAEPGSICVSRTVFEHAHAAIDVAFEDIGLQRIKNIAEPVRSYRVALTQKAADAPEPAAPARPDKPSVAVLPLTNVSGDAEQDYFADGLTEDLIAALSRIRQFFVIARNSSFAYKGKSPDIRTVASELGVRYVIEGSVRRSSRRIRLTAELLDGTSGAHLWAERYDRELADVFDLQDELSQTIVGAIEPELNRAEQQRARLKRPNKLDVWDLYQRGMAELHKLTRESLVNAETTLSKVTSMAPAFASAFAGIANVHYYRLVLGFSEDHLATRRAALVAGKRAIELDREDADAHCAVGRAYLSNRMFDDAIAEFGEAIAINPSHALAHYGLGATYVFRGRPEPSFTHLDDAIRLSPRDANMGSFLVRKAQALLYMRQYEEAIEWARRALRLPNFQWSRNAMLISALGHLDRPEEARAALDELLERIPNFSAQYALDNSPWLDDEYFRHMIHGLERAGLVA